MRRTHLIIIDEESELPESFNASSTLMRKIFPNLAEFISVRRRTIFDFAMIFLLGIVPFWRTGIEGMIGFIDTPVSFDPISSFSSRLYTWRTQYHNDYIGKFGF
jgi:hypothetical protein